MSHPHLAHTVAVGETRNFEKRRKSSVLGLGLPLRQVGAKLWQVVAQNAPSDGTRSGTRAYRTRLSQSTSPNSLAMFAQSHHGSQISMTGPVG